MSPESELREVLLAISSALERIATALEKRDVVTQPAVTQPASRRERIVADLDLRNRVHNVLRKHGVLEVDPLNKFLDIPSRQIQGMGQCAFMNVLEALLKAGVTAEEIGKSEFYRKRRREDAGSLGIAMSNRQGDLDEGSSTAA